MRRQYLLFLTLITVLIINIIIPQSVYGTSLIKNKAGIKNTVSLAETENPRDIKIIFNGKPLEFDVKPYIKAGRTLVPFRGILEAFGAEVIWDPEERAVITKSSTIEVYLRIGMEKAVVNKNQVILDVPPEILNNRTFIPLRFISENLGAEVKWDPVTWTVNITNKMQE